VTSGDGGGGEDTPEASHQPLSLPVPGRRWGSLHVSVVVLHGVGSLGGAGDVNGDVIVFIIIVARVGVLVFRARIDRSLDVSGRAPLPGGGPGRSARARSAPSFLCRVPDLSVGDLQAWGDLPQEEVAHPIVSYQHLLLSFIRLVPSEAPE
jgi:hypothetical protein